MFKIFLFDQWDAQGTLINRFTLKITTGTKAKTDMKGKKTSLESFHITYWLHLIFITFLPSFYTHMCHNDDLIPLKVHSICTLINHQAINDK